MMGSLKLGIICPSEIAFRRFLPACIKISNIEFQGVGVHSAIEKFGGKKVNETEIKEAISKQYLKAEEMVRNYGGRIFNSYEEIVTSSDIEAVYIPLPPALHYKWAKLALENNKHVLLEKPFTTNFNDTKDLICLAKRHNCAVHENYMFLYHRQLKVIKDIISNGKLGDIRLYRIAFGFPHRTQNDFRYNKELGGGAFLDAGGYTLKLASFLIGEEIKIKYSTLNYLDNLDVDGYGSATLVASDGSVVQVAFGMDNDYKCELEIWGSKGTLYTNRILTAPVGYTPEIIIKHNNEIEKISVESDDTFYKSILSFMDCITDKVSRINNYKEIEIQAKLADSFISCVEKY